MTELMGRYMYEKRKRNEKHLEEINPFPTPCLAVTVGKYIQHYWSKLPNTMWAGWKNGRIRERWEGKSWGKLGGEISIVLLPRLVFDGAALYALVNCAVGRGVWGGKKRLLKDCEQNKLSFVLFFFYIYIKVILSNYWW